MPPSCANVDVTACTELFQEQACCPPGEHRQPCLPGECIDQDQSGCCSTQAPNCPLAGTLGDCSFGEYPQPCRPGDVVDPKSQCCESAFDLAACPCGGHPGKCYENEGLNACGCCSVTPCCHGCPSTQGAPPVVPRKPPPPFLPGPGPQPINPPPGGGFYLGGALVEVECAPCEDGSIPSINSGCECDPWLGCGCGSFYCACQYERCLTMAEQNPLHFPGLVGITQCLEQLHACEQNPPPCPDYHTQVITKVTCLKCCNGSTPSPPDCACEACCTGACHPPPCAIGDSLDLLNGCCCPTSEGTTTIPAASLPAALRASTISAPPFALPPPSAMSEFLAATAAIGA